MPPDRSAAGLPFAVDDFAAAGRAFAAWRASGAQADRDVVAQWAYVYVRRHLYGRFAHERTGGPADVDAAITRAWDGVVQALDRDIEPARFASYVSVICARTVLHHRDHRLATVEADDETVPPDEPALPSPYAAEAVRADIAAALDGLPEAVAEVGRLRLLDGMDYDAIAERLGRPVASVRTYASRAVGRLRADPRLRAHYYDDVLPPGADGRAPDGI